LKSPVTRNILTLVSGNVVAFIVPVILYPFVSRIFTPQDYALFGVYFSLFTFLEIASAGRYDFAVVIPSRDEDSINLIAGGLIVAALYSMFLLGVFLIGRDLIAGSLNNPQLSQWLLLLPLALFLVSINKLCNAWLVRRKQFKASSINKGSQKIAEGSAQVALGLTKVGNGLVLGDLCGRLFNAAMAIFQSVRHGLDKNQVNRVALVRNLKQYIEFPKFGILPAMLNSLGGTLPVFIVSSYFTSEVSGGFNFSRMILAVPFSLIAAGISQALMQLAAERKNEGKPLYDDLISIARKLALLCVLVWVLLFFWGPELFSFVFGSKWRLAGEFSSILTISSSIALLVSPFSTLLIVLGKIRWLSLWQVSYFVLVSMLWLLRDATVSEFLWVFVLIDALAYLFFGLIIYRAVKVYENKISQGVE
jgi:O-antigen/teichoic acid export membrane protein